MHETDSFHKVTHFDSVSANTGHARRSFPSDSNLLESSLSSINEKKRLYLFSSQFISSGLI